MNINLKNALKNKKTIFWCIFVFAVFIRLIGFGTIPYGVNQDEAMGAVDAWALSLYGTDRFGISYPVHFTAWKVSQMSVLLSYCMIPFIKIFGLKTWVIRIPMLLASIGGIGLVYLVGKEIFGQKFGLVAMALTAINPWHFMQSRWAIDCNLFPHVFLLAFYLLLKAIKQKKYLYVSMVFFGLTFYCYGIALYSVTPFLVVFAIWSLKKKVFTWQEVRCSVLVFVIVALPEMLVALINVVHMKTAKLGPLTLCRFPESLRDRDILFLKFSTEQLWKNVTALVNSSFLQAPDMWFNSIPYFGPMYHISLPLMLIGMALLVYDLFSGKMSICEKQDEWDSSRKLALLGSLLIGIWVGIITSEVNVNRINIIFYPLIFMCAYAILWIAKRWKTALTMVVGLYGVCSILFLVTYFTIFPQKVAPYYNGDFLEAVVVLDEYEGPVYITGNMSWQFNEYVTEILTHYACKVDAKFYQDDEAYHNRYHFINSALYDWKHCDYNARYLLYQQDIDRMIVPYHVLEQFGEYYIIVPD